jgi:hypothetical protein
VIATADTIIATGRGPAEGHPSMANSFRAEGYGAASALLIVISYIEVHNIPTDGKTWILHIDNKSMVDRLAEHTTPWHHKNFRRKNSHCKKTEIYSPGRWLFYFFPKEGRVIVLKEYGHHE